MAGTLRSNGKSRHRVGGRKRVHATPLIAGATTLAIGFSGVLLTSGAAFAAPGYSESTARYISGELLERSLDEVAAIAGERAVANANTAPVVTESGDLELSALGDTVNLEVADGVAIPLSFLNAGVAGQFAQASQTGTARGATGAITNDGVISTDPTDPQPGSLGLDLTDLIGDDLTASVSDFTLSAGATSASADTTGAGAAVGDYAIGELTATATSPVLAGLSAAVLASGETVDAGVDEIFGEAGYLNENLDAALAPLGAADVTTTVDVDVDPALREVIENNTVLGADGPVQVNLANGEITVDIAGLLAANGQDLNDLEPGEDILTTELVGFITADVDELVNGFLQEAQEAVNATLDNAVVTVAATVGDPEAPVLTLNLDGSLAAIQAGDVVAEVTLAGADFDVAILNGLIEDSVTAALAVELNTNALDTTVDGLYPALDTVLTDLVRLQGNLQTTNAGVFTETALGLTVLNYTAEGEALDLNLAQASVGPNAAPTEDPSDGVTPITFTPGSGPETGGTPVVISGEGFTNVTEVLFGDVPATDFEVISPTEVRAVSPAGTGTAPITVQQGATSQTSTGNFVYLVAEAPVVAPLIEDVTPKFGPTTGGTQVTITGQGFNGTDDVFFDGVASEFEVISDTEIRAIAPANTAGSANVQVTEGAFSNLRANAFTYLGLEIPANGQIAAVTPANGPEAGGTVVTIIGSGFTGADGVNFGDTPGTGFEVISDNEIRVTSPAGVGGVAISVVGANVNPNIPSPIGFNYDSNETPNELPNVISISPIIGSTAGGTEVLFTGSGFTDVEEVFFGANNAASFTVVSDTEIRAITPAGAEGVVDVRLSEGGVGTLLAKAFTYVAGADAPVDGELPNAGELPPVVGGGDGTIVPAAGDTFENCDDAAAAGQSNFASTDPNLDADKDGIACETDGGAPTNASGDKLPVTGAEGVLANLLSAAGLLIAGAGAFLVGRKRLV